MHLKASITILIPLAVVMFFVLVQPILAQYDYRNFNSYNSKEFSVLYPPSWHAWNSTGKYVQYGMEQITIANDIIGDRVVNINNFPTKLQVTVIPSAVTGIVSEDILTSWIDHFYSPQKQRNYGMYALEDNPILLRGITARKISYNIDYLCGGSNIVTHNVVIFAYSSSSSNTYVISFIEPASKPQFDSVEVQSIIKSFEMKHFGTLVEFAAKNETPSEAVKEWAAQLKDLTPPLDAYGELDHTTNTPTPAPGTGQYLALHYTSPPQHC